MKKRDLMHLLVSIGVLILVGVILYLNHFYGFFIFSSPHLNQTYVSLRFDDGLKSQMQAFQLLKKYNFKGSVYVITSKLNGTDELDKSYYLNWTDLDRFWGTIAVGSHGANHLDLTRSEDYENEIIDSKKQLNDHGYAATVFVYPAGNYDRAALDVVEKYYDCAATQEVGTNYPPIDAYILKDFTVRRYNSIDTVERVIKPGKWNILAFHDIGEINVSSSTVYGQVADNNAISLQFFEEILKYIKQNKYKVITIEDGCKRFKNVE